ncbi:MAG: M48 family metalloprotease [Phycisphaerales bacterium]|nr:M48 family metalloprotease [Phycisphaerales bacterium]
MSIFGGQSHGYRRRPMGCNPRIVMAIVIALISIVSYYAYRVYNPVTGETQHINIDQQTEVALGLQASGEMAAQFGGLHPDPAAQERVDRIGQRLVSRSGAAKGNYPFEFHVLGDERTINAFALPGGQVFITAGLLNRLETDGQVAGVLSHEIVHVVGRHGAEHIAKQQLTQGLTGAAVLATYNPDDPSSRGSAAVALLIGQLVTMKYGRADESESDRWGVKFMAEAGYDPRAMIRVMEVLREASEGRGAPPEFFSTHPDPGRRIEEIEEAVRELYPNGVPAELER